MTISALEVGRSAASMVDRMPVGSITARGRDALVRVIETFINRWCMAGGGDGTREHVVHRVADLPFGMTLAVRVKPRGSYYIFLASEITADGATAWQGILKEECMKWRLG